FVSAWKLAKARYWLGTHAEEKSRKAYLEAGIAAGRAAIAAASDKPEGHFWVAANMGALVESFVLRQALTYNPASSATLYFLAETLIDEGKKDDARTVLQQLQQAPVDPDWAPEDREFKAKGLVLVK